MFIARIEVFKAGIGICFKCLYLLVLSGFLIGLEGLGVDIHKKLVNDGVVKKTSFSEFNELFDTHSR